MGKKIDLTGQRFGFLTVIEPAESIILKSGKPRTRWKCKCDCGNYIITATPNLQNGTSISCGCERKRRAAESRRNIMLQEIGKQYENLTILNVFRKNKRTIAKYICSCGTKGEALLDLIKRGNTSSCGCKKNDSKMEKECTEILNNSNLTFARNYTFKDLKYKGNLKFDFAIFDNNNKLILLIECQGIQHYIPQPNGFGDEQREITDPLKKEYCKKNNIELREIKYNEDTKERMNEILSECMLILCQASKEEGATTIQ